MAFGQQDFSAGSQMVLQKVHQWGIRLIPVQDLRANNSVKTAVQAVCSEINSCKLYPVLQGILQDIDPGKEQSVRVIIGHNHISPLACCHKSADPDSSPYFEDLKVS